MNLLWVGIAFAAAGLLWILVPDRATAIMSEGTLAKSTQLALGLKLRLAGQLHADEVITSPLTNTPCAAWSLKLISRDRSSQSDDEQWSVLARPDDCARGLRLQDAAGIAPLAPLGGDLHTAKFKSAEPGAPNFIEIVEEHVAKEERNRIIRIEERLVCEGTDVMVVGIGESYGGTVTLGGMSEFLMSTESNQEAKRRIPWGGIGSLLVGALLITAYFVG